MKENRFPHHEVKLQLYGARKKHLLLLVINQQHFILTRPHMTIQITLIINNIFI